METKICPRCKRQVPASANFCENCGWNFNKRNNKNKRRRYEELKFENVTLEALGDWVAGSSGKNEMISIRGNIRYYTKGIIFTREQYYVQWASIRYYPNTPGHTYMYAYSTHYDGFFSSGYKKVNKYIDPHVQNPKKVLFDITRHAHYQGGGSNEVWCRMAIWEV